MQGKFTPKQSSHTPFLPLQNQRHENLLLSEMLLVTKSSSESQRTDLTLPLIPTPFRMLALIHPFNKYVLDHLLCIEQYNKY